MQTTHPGVSTELQINIEIVKDCAGVSAQYDLLSSLSHGSKCMFEEVHRVLQSGQTLCNKYSEGQKLSTESDTDGTIRDELAESTDLNLIVFL